MIVMPCIVNMVIMMMVDWVGFNMMVDYWFDMFVVVVYWIRSVVVMMHHICRVMVIMVYRHGVMVMVTILAVMNAWWMPVLHMLVYFIMRYSRLLLTIGGFAVRISSPVDMVRRVGVNWVTNMTMREIWTVMVHIVVMYWPVMGVIMRLVYIMMVLVVHKDVVRSMVLMVDNCYTVRLTVGWAVWWSTRSAVTRTICMTGGIAMMCNHVAVAIHT